MEEINIIIRDIPTKFIKTEKYGELNYEKVKEVVWEFMDYSDDPHYDWDVIGSKDILKWLIDNKIISYNKIHRFYTVCDIDEIDKNDRIHEFYNKITEHERIMDK